MSSLYVTVLGDQWLWQCRRCDWQQVTARGRKALHACHGEKVRAGDWVEWKLAEKGIHKRRGCLCNAGKRALNALDKLVRG